MKYLIFAISICLVGCNAKEYKYDLCEFHNKNFTKDSLENFVIKLTSFNFNNVQKSDTSSFYGVFQGYDLQNQLEYNVLAFKTKIPSSRLVKVNSDGPAQVAIKIYKNVACFNFNSSFDIFNVINKKNPIIMGELVLYIEDPH